MCFKTTAEIWDFYQLHKFQLYTNRQLLSQKWAKNVTEVRCRVVVVGTFFFCKNDYWCEGMNNCGHMTIWEIFFATCRRSQDALEIIGHFSCVDRGFEAITRGQNHYLLSVNFVTSFCLDEKKYERKLLSNWDVEKILYQISPSPKKKRLIFFSFWFQPERNEEKKLGERLRRKRTKMLFAPKIESIFPPKKLSHWKIKNINPPSAQMAWRSKNQVSSGKQNTGVPKAKVLETAMHPWLGKDVPEKFFDKKRT